MTTTKYAKGRNIEYKVIAFLEAHGYHCTRAASSKGKFDVIAYNEQVVRFIQVKLTAKRSVSQYKAELKQIAETAVPMACPRELWVYVNRQGFTDVILVNPLAAGWIIPEGVIVWQYRDGDMIEQMEGK